MIVFEGSGLGRVDPAKPPALAASYGVDDGSGPPQTYAAVGCEVLRATVSRAVRCTTVAGSGGPHAWTLAVDGLRVAVGSALRTWYVVPTIERIDGPGATRGSTRGSEVVYLHGDGFGDVGTRHVARYGRGEAPDASWRSAVECEVVAGVGASFARALLTAPAPAPLRWQLDAGERAPKTSTATTSYAPPLVTRFAGPGASEASTRGGQRITIGGDHFGSSGATIDSVRYGDLGEPEFDATPSCDVLEAHTKIVCTTVAGAGGVAIEWFVTIDGQASIAPHTSAAAPRVDGVELFNRTDGASLPHASVAGGDGLRVRGEHFADSARRIDWVRYGVVGAELEALECAVVEAHTLVECTTPPGGGASLPLTLSVSGQPSVGKDASAPPAISYAPPRLASIAPARPSTAGGGRLTLSGEALGPPTMVAVELDGVPLQVLEARKDGRELVVRSPVGTGAQRGLIVKQRAAVEGGVHDAHQQRSLPLTFACVRASRLSPLPPSLAAAVVSSARARIAAQARAPRVDDATLVVDDGSKSTTVGCSGCSAPARSGGARLRHGAHRR